MGQAQACPIFGMWRKTSPEGLEVSAVVYVTRTGASSKRRPQHRPVTTTPALLLVSDAKTAQ